MTDDRSCTVRAEDPQDAAAIASLVAAAFGSQTQVQLIDAIRRGVGYVPELALVAEVDGRVVGHVMVSSAWLQDGDRVQRVATLSPLAVLAEFQGRGIGASLVREVTRLADLRREPVVVLEGDPRLYSRFGFEPAAVAGITVDLPSWAPPEAAQMLRLRLYDPSLRGHLVFPALDAIAGHPAPPPPARRLPDG